MTTEEEDIFFMKEALREARIALEQGEVPVGAVVVKEGKVLARAYNLREKLQDPAAHAELLALRAAAELTGSWRLTGSALYVTKEPCVMCSGAIINARVQRVVFGCTDAKAGGAKSVYSILTEARLNHRVELKWGVLEAECASLLRDFFRERR